MQLKKCSIKLESHWNYLNELQMLSMMLFLSLHYKNSAFCLQFSQYHGYQRISSFFSWVEVEKQYLKTILKRLKCCKYVQWRWISANFLHSVAQCIKMPKFLLYLLNAVNVLI